MLHLSYEFLLQAIELVVDGLRRKISMSAKVFREKENDVHVQRLLQIPDRGQQLRCVAEVGIQHPGWDLNRLWKCC